MPAREWAPRTACLLSLIFFSHALEKVTPESVIVKIVGGHEVSIVDYPYQVSLRMYDQHICGGSLIANHYILTAAHCVVKYLNKIEFMGVGMGHSRLNDRQMIRKVNKVVVHPGFKVGNFVVNDIAIVQLRKSADVNNVTRKIIEISREPPPPGQLCTITGWGSLIEPPLGKSAHTVNQLRAADIPIVNPRICSKLSGVNESYICAGGSEGGIDSCQGDSGGPLACNGRLAGVVSWGIGCGRKGYPGFYTDVSYFAEWISNNSLAIPSTNLYKTVLFPCLLVQLTYLL